MSHPRDDDAFSSAYAAAYDSLYATKDYDAECDMLERAFSEYADFTIRRILDLGCGTGGHAIPLAYRGYDVVGVDRSAHMLGVARVKADASGTAPRIVLMQQDLASLSVVESCDAAVMMFAVLGYLGEQGSAEAALRSARANLRDGALLVLDVWHAPAVLRDPPQPRWLLTENGGTRLIRLASSMLDPTRDVCTVTFRLLTIDRDRIVSETVEEHRVRYYTDQQISDLLDSAGFELLRIGAFPDYRREPGDSGWSALIVAQARCDGRSSVEISTAAAV
jgi:SAM-dependent methyltransferase